MEESFESYDAPISDDGTVHATPEMVQDAAQTYDEYLAWVANQDPHANFSYREFLDSHAEVNDTLKKDLIDTPGALLMMLELALCEATMRLLCVTDIIHGTDLSGQQQVAQQKLLEEEDDGEDGADTDAADFTNI